MYTKIKTSFFNAITGAFVTSYCEDYPNYAVAGLWECKETHYSFLCKSHNNGLVFLLPDTLYGSPAMLCEMVNEN